MSRPIIVKEKLRSILEYMAFLIEDALATANSEEDYEEVYEDEIEALRELIREF